MFYDLVHSPDGIVTDVRETARLLVDRLGLIEPKESWYQTSGCHGYEALFTRVHPSRILAPSRLEVITSRSQRDPAAANDIPAYIEDVSRAQGSRPLKTHATVLTSSVIGELREHLLRNGVRHRVDPPSDDLGHERLWVGFAPGEGSSYQPHHDGGIRFEVIPTQCLSLPAAVATGDTADDPCPTDCSMTRVAARTYLVEDLSLLTTLETCLGWPPEQVDGRRGSRRAVMAVNFPRSARIEFCEPGYDDDTKAFYAAWGEGTFATRIAVGDIEAKVRDLAERGTGLRRVTPNERGPDVVRVDANVVPGFLFDFVDEGAGD